MYMSNLCFQSQVEEGQENLARRQEVSATNFLFREILLSITEISFHYLMSILCYIFVLQDLESKVAELQRREQELQRMQFGGI